METQKISVSTKYQFEKIIDKKETGRFPSVIRVEQDKIIVTDGHILFCAEHQQEEADFKPVNVDPTDLSYERKKWKTLSSVMINQASFQEYPKYKQVIPEFKDLQQYSIVVNPKNMIKALQTIGGECVRFNFGDPYRIFLLSSCSEDKNDCFAMLMPSKGNTPAPGSTYFEKFKGITASAEVKEPEEITEEREHLENMQRLAKLFIKLNEEISSGAGAKRFRKNRKQVQKENVWYEVKDKKFMEVVSE